MTIRPTAPIPAPLAPRLASRWAARMSRLALLPLAAFVLAACHAPATIDERQPYPAELQQAATLDVQVVRDETHITMTNTTARDFGPSTLWLNQWYSREIEGFAPGQTLRLHLADFEDKFGDAFRAGGFFATDIPQQIALVQIESGPPGARTLTGLVYVNEPGTPR